MNLIFEIAKEASNLELSKQENKRLTDRVSLAPGARFVDDKVNEQKLYIHTDSGEIKTQKGWEIYIEKEQMRLYEVNHAREMSRIDYWINFDTNFYDSVSFDILKLVNNDNNENNWHIEQEIIKDRAKSNYNDRCFYEDNIKPMFKRGE